MNTPDIRWKQRFSNYVKAFQKLEQAVQKVKNEFQITDENAISPDAFLDHIIKEGLIHRFKYTHELAWNVMNDFLVHSGNTNSYGSRDATREAFAQGLIENGEIWMDMVASRNKTSHIYNEETADDIFIKNCSPIF